MATPPDARNDRPAQAEGAGAARETVRLALSNLADSAALVILSPEGRQARVVRGRVERGETLIDADGGRESLAPEVLAAVDRAATEELPLAVPSQPRRP